MVELEEVNIYRGRFHIERDSTWESELTTSGWQRTKKVMLSSWSLYERVGYPVTYQTLRDVFPNYAIAKSAIEQLPA